MRVLAIKCFKRELGWIVIDGSARLDASIVAYCRVSTPNGPRGEQLVWTEQEVVEAVSQHHPDQAALSMAEGQSALAERSQMDGVVLASLYKRDIPATRLFTATVKSKFSGLKKAEIASTVAAYPVAEGTTIAQRELLTVALAMLAG